MRSSMIRILVTGGRHRTDRNTVWAALDQAVHGHQDITVVHGACPYGGADQHAAEWCRDRIMRLTGGATIAEEPHPADWNTHGRRAGPVRNTAMVQSGADLCLGFPDPDSRGTWDCLRRAWTAGIPTIIHRLPDDPPTRVLLRGAEARNNRATINASAGSRLANPFRPGDRGVPDPAAAVDLHRRWLAGEGDITQRVGSRQYNRLTVTALLGRLGGWDLGCPCALDRPCHADTLLALANPR
jgi:hypothetical protein